MCESTKTQTFEKEHSPTRQGGVCSKKRDAEGKKIRREAKYYCEVPLCVTPCFRLHQYTVSDIYGS
nr:unnamed protein product [Callosobruchus analis]